MNNLALSNSWCEIVLDTYKQEDPYLVFELQMQKSAFNNGKTTSAEGSQSA